MVYPISKCYKTEILSKSGGSAANTSNSKKYTKAALASIQKRKDELKKMEDKIAKKYNFNV